MKNLIRKHNRKILNRNTKRTPTARVIQSAIPMVIPTPTKPANWKLKSENSQYTIKWSIMKKVKAYKPGSKRCNLCLEEKLLIMKAKKTECLNKRSDLFSKCRHVTRYLLNQIVK